MSEEDRKDEAQGTDENDSEVQGETAEDQNNENEGNEEDTEAEALRARISDLEAENETLKGDDETYEEKLARERKKTEALAADNRRLANKVTKAEIIKQYPGIDPTLIVGDNKKEMLASAKKQADLKEKIKAEVRAEIEAEVKAEIGEPVKEAPGATAKNEDLDKQIDEAMKSGNLQEVTRLTLERGQAKQK